MLMAVAKSFQSFDILTEPYLVGDKAYVKVRNPKTKSERQVRWYTDAEYRKMYPEEVVIAVTGSSDPYARSQKDILGFEKGYITIFSGDIDTNEDWFCQSIARYAKWWGWYIISSDEVPAVLPIGVSAIRLPWEIVGQDNGRLKPEAAIKTAIENLLYEPDTSEWVGAVGERLNLTLTITNNQQIENGFGTSTKHTMKDADGNVFIWFTAAKNWSVGDTKHIRGTVKQHSTSRNTKETILTRCAEL